MYMDFFKILNHDSNLNFSVIGFPLYCQVELNGEQ